MGSVYQDFLEKKYTVLEAEFSRINKDGNDYIDKKELAEFVHSYESETNQPLPDTYCEKLFKLIDLNHDNNITIQEFIISYMLIEERLKLKKIKLTKTLKEIELYAEKSLKDRDKHKSEQLNEHGVASDATLNLVLLEARELKPMDFNGKSDPYCVFTLNGQQKQKSTYKPNTLDPVWNEQFNL